MILLPLLGSIALLNGFSCAEVSTNVKPISLEDLSPALLHEISSYLDNPFSDLIPLNHHFRDLFSKTYTVKRVFNDRFNIPELVTDDIKDNEVELKFLLKYSKFAKNPDHVYQAFKNEFLEGNKLGVIIPHLVKYFNRYVGNEQKDSQYKDGQVLLKHKKFDYMIQSGISPFNYEIIDHEDIKRLQMYALRNPEFIEKNRSYLCSVIRSDEDDDDIKEWFTVALATNMPEMFFQGFPYALRRVLVSKGFWTKLFISKHLYQALFDRLNIIIDHMFTGSDLVYYKLLNSIRFGTEESGIYESQIQSRSFSSKRINFMCHCASLSNKMDLFHQLLNNDKCTLLWDLSSIDEISVLKNLPIETYKLLFDLHSISDTQSARQSIYDRTNFIQVLSKYCRVTSIQWRQMGIEIDFETPSHALESGIPASVNIRHKLSERETLLCFLFKIPHTMKFDNAEVFETFLFHFSREEFQYKHCFINGDNLKLIVQSESIIQLLRENFADPIFFVELEELIKVVDGNVVSLQGLVKLADSETSCLSDLKTKNQLKSLETLLGVSVAKWLKPDFEYFKYRHVYRYLVDAKQKLPENLSNNTHSLLEIDFPNLKVLK